MTRALGRCLLSYGRRVIGSREEDVIKLEILDVARGEATRGEIQKVLKWKSRLIMVPDPSHQVSQVPSQDLSKLACGSLTPEAGACFPPAAGSFSSSRRDPVQRCRTGCGSNSDGRAGPSACRRRPFSCGSSRRAGIYATYRSARRAAGGTFAYLSPFW